MWKAPIWVIFLVRGLWYLIFLCIPFHYDLAKRHTNFIFINSDGWRRIFRWITEQLYSPTLSLNWLNELKLISSSLTIIMRANSVILMTFFWHSPCWFPLSRPGCRPAAAMYVLPIVLIFSMFESSGLDRSFEKRINYILGEFFTTIQRQSLTFFSMIYTIFQISFFWRK